MLAARVLPRFPPISHLPTRCNYSLIKRDSRIDMAHLHVTKPREHAVCRALLSGHGCRMLMGGACAPMPDAPIHIFLFSPGSEPTFGTFDRLSRLQENYAKVR